MSDVEPTAADRELAEKIWNLLREKHPWRPSADEIAALIARHVAAREAGLRAEIERLRQLVESAFQDGWMHGAACGNPNGGYATYDWEQSDSCRELTENTP